MRSKQASEMLLQLLNDGERVEHNGTEYAMDIEGKLCILMKDESNNEKPIGLDCDLKSFRQLAESIGKDELWLKCCATQLRKLR